MPLYQYRCRDCGHEFEARQRMSDDPLTECPVCQGPVRRVVRPVGIVFKGSGFYVTDNRSASPNGQTKSAASSAEKKKEPEASEKKAESKKEKVASKD